MDPEIETILEDEEEEYHYLLKKLVNKSRSNIFSRLNEKRINEELDIIHSIKKSKTIFFLFALVQECIRNDEPYIVSGTLGDLYILYVLQLIKYNPIDYGCCYQSCLGIKDRPKPSLFIEIYIRHQFIDHLYKVAKTMDGESKAYHYSFDINRVEPYNPNSMILLNEDIDVDKYFAVRHIGNEEMSVLAEQDSNSFDYGVIINLVPSDTFSINKDFLYKYGEPSFKLATESFCRVSTDNRFLNDFEVAIFKKHKPQTFKDVVFGLSKCFAAHYNHLDIDRYYFVDRESVFDYFRYTLRSSEEYSYRLMEDIRRGIFRKKYFEDEELNNLLTEEVFNEFVNISYLPTKCFIIQNAYYLVLRAYYFENYLDEYLEINKKYIEE